MATHITNRGEIFIMEKYISFDQIKKNDVYTFSGLENEIITCIFQGSHKVPLTIETFGITFPNPNYHIKRTSSKYFVLEYIISGKGYLKVDDKKFDLHANDVYLLEPCSSHEYYADPTDPFKKCWINFKSDLFLTVFDQYDLRNTYVFQNTDIYKEMLKLLKLEEVSIHNDQIYMQASEYLFSIFMKLATNKPVQTKASELFQKILFKLDRAIDSTISIEEICNDLFISRSTLIREFKKYHHMTPHAYLLNRKITFSKMLLENTNHSVKEISSRLGFADSHYFCSVFKKKTNMTPSDYRISHSNLG